MQMTEGFLRTQITRSFQGHDFDPLPWIFHRTIHCGFVDNEI